VALTIPLSDNTSLAEIQRDLTLASLLYVMEKRVKHTSFTSKLHRISLRAMRRHHGTSFRSQLHVQLALVV